MITAFNPEIGDCLIVMLKKADTSEHETKENITRLFVGEETVGYNFFDCQKDLGLETAGQVFLNEKQIAYLNQRLKEAGFLEALVLDDQPKIVVGYVESCIPHPDSDHLSITQTKVSDTKTLQIVCGAKNVAAGQKVVVALPGALMPDGTPIWPGSLRGVESFGMLCSARELHLPDAPQVKGILVLPEDAVVGESFFK